MSGDAKYRTEDATITVFRGGATRAQMRPSSLLSRLNLLNVMWREFQAAHCGFEEPCASLKQGLMKEFIGCSSALELKDLLNHAALSTDGNYGFVLERLGLSYREAYERLFFEWLALIEALLLPAVPKEQLVLWKTTFPSSSCPLLKGIFGSPQVDIPSMPVRAFVDANAGYQYLGFCPRVPEERISHLLTIKILPLIDDRALAERIQAIHAEIQALFQEHATLAKLAITVSRNQELRLALAPSITVSRLAMYDKRRLDELMKGSPDELDLLREFMLFLNCSRDALTECDAQRLKCAHQVNALADRVQALAKDLNLLLK
jgi:hypothetical protein